MLASLLHTTPTTTTISSPHQINIYCPDPLTSLHHMDPRAYGRYPNMNEMQSWYMNATNQRQNAQGYYNSAQLLGRNATWGRGAWDGTRDIYNPYRHYRLPPRVQLQDMGSGGQFLNWLDGYSGYGPPGQSLFAHHISRQLEPHTHGFGFSNAAERHRTFLGNQRAQNQMRGAGVTTRDFADYRRW